MQPSSVSTMTVNPCRGVFRSSSPTTLMPEIRISLDDEIPRRAPNLGPNLLDLTAKYNGVLRRTWYQFPTVPEVAFAQLLDDPKFIGLTTFDVRGVIQLRGDQLHRKFP